MSEVTSLEQQEQLNEQQELSLRARRLRWGAPLVALLALGLGADASLLWVQQSAWQGLVIATGYLVWAGCVLVAWHLAGQQRVRLAARLIFYPLLLTGVLAAACLEQAQWLLIGALLVVGWPLCFLVFARRRIYFWVGVLFIGAALIYLVSLIPLWPRVSLPFLKEELIAQ